MLQTVDTGERSLEAYRGIAPDAVLDRLLRAAEPLRGARVLHLNATSYGGGVSELLRSAVPLLNDLGLVAEWKVISGDEAFFTVTKAIHNGLQGADRDLTAAEQDVYRQTSERNAALLTEQFDFVFVHDPQPAAILPLHGAAGSRWVWRCHIDTGQPNPQIWEFLRAYLTEYDAAVFTLHEFQPPDLPIERVRLIPPAIDPLSPKNLELADHTAQQVLDWLGIQLDRPLISQISRFDPWKDPLGVIAAYRLAREEVPELQLTLAGSMALDDPEGWETYREIQTASRPDPLVHVLANLGSIEVNALQRLSDIVVQKSLREGFGLVVSEALWKSTPVVAGRTGGIPLQMADGVGGMLVDGVEECAAAIVSLLRDPERARELGARGHDRVRERFLLPRLLLDEVDLLAELAEVKPIDVRLADDETRDPVCGMTVPTDGPAPTLTLAGRTYRFCSDYCRARLAANPGRFLRTAP